MLKILHASKYYYPDTGGVETVVRTITTGLCRYFDFVALVCKKWGIGKYEIIEGIAVRRCSTLFTLLSLPIAPFYPLWLWWKMRRVDIVDYHYPFPLVDMAVSIFFPKTTKLVIHWHSDIISQQRTAKLLAPVLKKCLQRADKIIVATPLHIDYSPSLTAFRDKCVVIPYGVDVEAWQTLTPAQQQAVQNTQLKYPRLVLAIGRLVSYKGYANLIEAMRQVNGQLIIVGDGPLRAELQALIIKHSLADKVILNTGTSHEDLQILLHAAKMLAFPSILPSEAFGIVQLQAMSCGKPIINTALKSGVPWVARDQKEAITIPPGDTAALSLAINTLLEDNVLAKRLGDAGLQRAKELFSQQQFLQQTKHLYESLGE